MHSYQDLYSLTKLPLYNLSVRILGSFRDHWEDKTRRLCGGGQDSGKTCGDSEEDRTVGIDLDTVYGGQRKDEDPGTVWRTRHREDRRNGDSIKRRT